MNILLVEKFKKHMLVIFSVLLGTTASQTTGLAELLSVDFSTHSSCIAETQRLNTLGGFAANDILSYLQYTYYP